jgi:outer membrane protein assembly factor BamB
MDFIVAGMKSAGAHPVNPSRLREWRKGGASRSSDACCLRAGIGLAKTTHSTVVKNLASIFPPMKSVFCLVLCLTFGCIISTAWSAEWPEWRGAGGLGVVGQKGLVAEWSETKNVAWKAEIPGKGWSSPVIEGGLVWMTTAIETAASKEVEKERLKTNTSDQKLTILEKVELRAVAVDRKSGQVKHNVLLLSLKQPQWVHALNSYASPSPVVQDGRLYCHFGALGTACVETATGKILWTNTELVVMHENGPGSSPVLWQGRLIFHMDGSDQQYVLWKTARSGKMHDNPQFKKSYGTPIVVSVNGQEQLLSPGSDWLYSYDADGKELWKLEYGDLGFSLTPRPVIGNGMIYLSTGFMKAQLLAVRYEGLKQPEVVWRCTRGVPTMPSPLLVGNEIYFVSDGGILTCLDANTGEEHYRERLGSECSSSPTAAEGRIYVSLRDGTTVVVKAGKAFTVESRNELPGRIFASLAAADGAWFLRTEAALYKLAGAK